MKKYAVICYVVCCLVIVAQVIPAQSQELNPSLLKDESPKGRERFASSALPPEKNYRQIAKTPDELTAQDIYAYLWDQTVVTVSRRKQKVSEAPASVTVITEEDIRRSGALNFQDLFRQVAGMDVAGLTQQSAASSMRGFNSIVSRTILVLLNGNPLYQEVTQSPFWSAFPITLQDVERIEIVRGPGSALWGANAFSGVINIITKSPEKFPACEIRESAGDIGTTYTDFIAARKTDRFQYKLHYGHEQMRNVTLNPKEPARRRNIYNFELKYKTQKQRDVSLMFGYTNPSFAIINHVYTIVEGKYSKEFIHLTYNIDNDTWIKIRQNHTQIGNPRQGIPYKATTFDPFGPGDEKSISIEAQSTKRFQHLGILTYGTEYKFVKAFWLGPRRTQGLGSLFAQHDLPLNNKLSLIMGGRVDTHPEVKTAISPRVSLMYTPHNNHVLRLTGATAYRRPSFGELYTNYMVFVPFPPFPPIAFPLVGNENLKSERIKSVEIGYTLKLTKRTKLSSNFYRNILDNFIDMPRVGGTYIIVNRNKATQNGAEVELETVYNQNLKGFANYAYNYTKDTLTGRTIEMSPIHKANAGLGWMPAGGLYGNLVFNFVDDTRQTVFNEVKKAEAYRNWDLNLGYRFTNKLKGLNCGLSAQNVLNKKRKDYPAGDTFKRRVVATISYSF